VGWRPKRADHSGIPHGAVDGKVLFLNIFCEWKRMNNAARPLLESGKATIWSDCLRGHCLRREIV
jgi:hypothetical protein